MIESIKIDNFKSIESLSITLGRVNVFVGENGAGKSNLLEAIALAAAAEAGKLDNEFLASRGIRVSSAAMMRSAFDARRSADAISISVRRRGGSDVRYQLTNDNAPYSTWENHVTFTPRPKKMSDVGPFLQGVLERLDDDERHLAIKKITDQIQAQIALLKTETPRESPAKISIELDFSLESNKSPYVNEGMDGFQDFLIYSPENSALRTYETESQIQPLGVNGEGLLRFLEIMSSHKDKSTINRIKEALHLFSWFDDFGIKKRRSGSRMAITDQYIDKMSGGLDHRSANEGFLFVAFYFALMSSKLTPTFFALDNVDVALNPKLCQMVVRELAQLARENEKQIILTTHNPAVLDGLDLTDSEQRLFIVSRSNEGKTRVRRYKEKPSTGAPLRMSELFLRGALGGLPKGF
jgi:predicted ATPase